MQAIWKPVAWIYPGLNGQKLQPWLEAMAADGQGFEAEGIRPYSDLYGVRNRRRTGNRV